MAGTALLGTGLAWASADRLVGHLFERSRYGGEYALAAQAAAAVVRGGVTVVVGLVGYLLARALVVAPVTAAVDRLLTDPGGDPLGDTVDALGRTVGAAVRREGVRLLVAVVGTLVGVAVYLSVGTLLEAIGYALGLYAAVPVVASVAAIGGAALVGWMAAAALLWTPGAVGRSDAGATGLAVGIERARDRPLGAALDAVVVTLLSVAPLVVGLATLLVLPGERSTELLGAALSVVLVGTVSGGLAAAYRAVVVGRAEQEGSTRSDRREAPAAGVGDRVSRRRVVVAVALLVSAAVLGGAVRAADLRPGGSSAATGPTADDPEVAVEGALDRVADRSRTVRTVTYLRTVDPPNGTVEPWRVARYRVTRLDPGGPAASVYVALQGADGNWTDAAAYATRSAYVQVDRPELAEDPRGPDRPANRLLAGEHVRTRTPSELEGSGVGDGVAESSVADLVRGEWRRVDRRDGVVRFRSNDSAAVSDFTDFLSAGETEYVGVTVAVDADTGRLRQATVRATVNRSDDGTDGELIQRRTVHRVTDVGATTVRRPPRTTVDPLAVALDALFY